LALALTWTPPLQRGAAAPGVKWTRKVYNGPMSGLVTLATVLDPSALQASRSNCSPFCAPWAACWWPTPGGTDSAYLAWAAHQALGDNAVRRDRRFPLGAPLAHARGHRIRRQFGIRHEIVETREFENPAYSANNPDRCFHCKDELFRRMEEIAPAFELRLSAGQAIVYGVNTDDLGDYRPGQKAAQSHAVKAPLVEAGLSKAEIRELSRLAGLPTWDRPRPPVSARAWPMAPRLRRTTSGWSKTPRKP